MSFSENIGDSDSTCSLPASTAENPGMSNVLTPGETPSSTGPDMPSYHQLAVESDDDSKVQDLPESQATCYGYRYSVIKVILYVLFNIIFLGAPYLVGRWNCQLKVRFQCNPQALRKATVVLIKDSDDRYAMCSVQEDKINIQRNEFNRREEAWFSQSAYKKRRQSLLHSQPVVRNFDYHHEKYIWDSEQSQYRRIEGLEGYTCNDILNGISGHSPTKYEHMRTIFGTNLIDVEVTSYGKLLISEVLNPFYMFQVFSIGLWSVDGYLIYACCIFLISGLSIALSLRQTRKQLAKIRNMAHQGIQEVIRVRRSNGDEMDVDSVELVPGDVILIPPEGYTMTCDAVVITGTCIVNESMLTGESIPVHKAAILPSNLPFESDTMKKHTLFAGTRVIQTRYYEGERIACMVIRTGFNTMKGHLVRSILFPKKISGVSLYEDAIRFIWFLATIAVCGMAWSVHMYVARGSSAWTVIVRVLDVVTIVVPPALPAAMTVGIVYAQSRLAKKNIYCTSPNRINICGQISLVCFDKTGTLTEDGLDLWCVVPFDENSGDFGEPMADPSLLQTSSQFLRGLATCHSLTYIKQELVGDPLDLKMFLSTNFELNEPVLTGGEETRRFDTLAPSFVKRDDFEIGTIRVFEFIPQLQCMSVLVKTLDSPLIYAYCKGSPERISRLCKTLPANYDRLLDSFTVKGYRVLALGWRPLEGLSWHKSQRIPREEVEKDMMFGGFLVMQNSLKLATNPVIAQLSHANIRSVMVTGDHLLTAISVARECGMIPSCDKVVVVHADEDGGLKFMLAAHHYELVSDEEDSGHHSEDMILPGNDLEINDVSLVQDVPTSHRARRTSLQSTHSGGDALIDMDRLVPIIVPEMNKSQMIVDLSQSNYHFVLTGKTWAVIMEKCSQSVRQKILAKGTVFARMSPECKMELVEQFQSMEYVVLMCGDGANDCSALKMANVGISLSEAEASVAAPFTSKIDDISCVPIVIMEGRCALVTSFGMFKYMALYSLIQFTSVLLLYMNYTNFADAHFLYVDLGITTAFALVMGRTLPYDKIAPKPPSARLVSFQNLCSVSAQIVICVGLQIVALTWLKQQDFFVPVHVLSPDPDELQKKCWETTTILCVSAFQYIIVCITFSIGPPYRKHLYTNKLLLLLITVQILATIFITVYPIDDVSIIMALMPVDKSNLNFRLTLLLLPVVNIILSILFEKNIVAEDSIPVKIVNFFGLGGKKPVYETTMSSLAKDNSWPRIEP